MKQNLVIILFLAFVLGTFSVAHAQLSGTIDIGTGQTYTTLAAAISALNTQGVGVPGVTLNLLAGNPETSPNGGYSITTLTGASDRPIVIRGNNNIITAPETHTVGAINDAIFKIIGGDWITIQGFDMREHSAARVYTAASNNMTEFGVALFYATATNGCKNITIQNNLITLERLYQNSFGIYSNSRHTATAMTTAADITSTDGANDNLKIYSNIISNVNMGIIVVGSLTGDFMAPGLDIGGSGVGTANTISNFGNTGTFSGYISVSGSVNGILINNQQNFNISYNQITSSIGGTTAGTLRGIYVQTTGTLPTTGSFTRTILYNNVSVRSAVAAGTMVGIANEGGNLTTTIDINYNNFHTTTHTLAATGAITFISQIGACQTQRVLDNTFTNISMNTTGAVILINTGNTMPASGVQNVNYNRIVGTFTKTVAGGNLTGIVTNSSSPAGSNSSMTYNNFSNITVSGTSVVTGIQNTDGGAPSKTITFNTFENWTGGTGLLNPLNINYNGASSISDNLINNIVGTGAVTGILIGSSGQSTPPVTVDVARNTVQTLRGTGTVTGISSACPNSETNIFRNSVKDLTGNGTAGLSYGLVVIGGAIHNVYNNVICNLKAPDNTGTVASINTIRLTGGTTNNISYNTTYLDATGSSANFSTASLFISAGDNTLLNNIFVNKSVPGSTGRTVVIWKTTAGNANIGAGSATNIYHAGDELENQLIGYFVATPYISLANYKAALVDRDLSSYWEDVAFVNAAACDLRINPGRETRVESNATYIATILRDFLHVLRHGSRPDIGAYEGDYMPVLMPPATPIYVSPGAGISGVAINAPLVWSANPEGGTPASYDVRFGVVNPPGFAINVATTSYNPAKLFNQLYYWQVKAYNAQGESDWTVVRDFTTATGIPVLTYPGVDAIGIPEQLTFTWGAIAGVSGYKIKIGTTSGGSQVANMVPCATNSYVRAVPLAYNTLHFWSVYSVNGAQEVQSLERSFTTRPDPTISNFPWTETFEANSPSRVNWSQIQEVGTKVWTYATGAGGGNITTARSGTLNARFTATSGGPWRTKLVSPPINLSANPVHKLSFWYGQQLWSPDQNELKVFYRTSPSSSWVEIAHYTTDVNVWTLVPNLALPNPSATYQIAFEGIDKYGYANVLDDVMVEVVSTSPVFEITPNSKNFGDVQIGTTTAPTVFTIRNAGGGILIINPPISITGTDAERFILTDTNSYPKELTANQTMTVSVAFQPGTIGDKVASLRVVDNIDVKQERLFGLSGKGVDNTVYNLPKIFTFTPATDVNGWMVFASSPAVSGLWSLPNANLAGGTAPELHHHYPSGDVSGQWTRLVSPPIAVSGLAQVTIKFRHWFDVYGTGLNLQFQYSYNAVDWTPLWNVNATTNLGPEELTFPITMAKADRLYLSWYTFGNQYNIDSWDIDNIRILPPNTQVNQTTAAAGVANVAVPPIIDESNSNTINASVNITNLTPPNALVNVSIGYADYSLYNAGLSFVLSGTTFGGTTVVVTHDLGFIPVQIAYRIGTGAWIMVMAQPSWTTTTVTIVIPGKMGKNDDDVTFVFPQAPEQTLPVELASFTATFDVSMFVKIAWVTASETNHLGYNILRGDSNNVGNAIQLNQNVITPADGVALGTQMSYKFIDNEIYNNETYYYWLESVDLDGTSNLHGPITVLVTLDPEDPGTPPIPLFTKLMEAYPNPFNPSTKISYSLKEAGKVRIEVYNVKGQMIRTYDNDHSTPGYYHILWDGKDTSGRNVSSGLYLYRMISGNYRESKKMVLAK